MDEQMTSQIADTAVRMAAAVEAIEKSLERLAAQQEAIEQKVASIVAAIEERTTKDSGINSPANNLNERVAQLESENQELKAQAQRALRKTLPPLVSALLHKSGYEEGSARMDASAMDKALGSLSLEQRIAVKAEMARAGMIE